MSCVEPDPAAKRRSARAVRPVRDRWLKRTKTLRGLVYGLADAAPGTIDFTILEREVERMARIGRRAERQRLNATPEPLSAEHSDNALVPPLIAHEPSPLASPVEVAIDNGSPVWPSPEVIEPAARGTTAMAAATALLALEQTSGERPVRQIDLLWALVNEQQLLIAQRYLHLLEVGGTGGLLAAANVPKLAALVAFVRDDTCAVAGLYHETLIASRLDSIEALLACQKTLGLSALAMAASLQAAMFFPACGAARLLRASIPGLPSELSALLRELALLSEQGFSLVIEDFATPAPASTRESHYRQQRIRPVIDNLLAQLPLAVSCLRGAIERSRTLEDEAGCRTALAALEALRNAVSLTAESTAPPDVRQWLHLAETFTDAKAVIEFVASGFDYQAIAQRAIDAHHLKLAQTLLYELARTLSTDPCAHALRSFVQERLKFIDQYAQRAQAIHKRLQQALLANTISQSDFASYEGWIRELQRAAREDAVDAAALRKELSEIESLLDEAGVTPWDQLTRAIAELRASLTAASAQEAQPWFEAMDRKLSDGDLLAAEGYLQLVRSMTSPSSSHAHPHRHRLIRDKPEQGSSQPSPLVMADELRLLAFADAGAVVPDALKPFAVVAIFGVPAAGIAEVSLALQSLHHIEHRSIPSLRTHTIHASQIESLQRLRELTHAIGINAAELTILHIEMPSCAQDPDLLIEILEHVYTLRTQSIRHLLRVVLTFDATATRDWLSERGEWVESELVCISLKPWSCIGVHQWLSELRRSNGPVEVESLCGSTGGWHRLLRSFVDEHAIAPPAAARDALQEFGLFDVPAVGGIFTALVANGLQDDFDADVLSLLMAENPEHAALPLEALLPWSERLGLVERHSLHGREHLRLDPFVTQLIERCRLPS